MRFDVHPCIISIHFCFQQNSYPICVVSDDVTKSVEVCHRKACKLLGINSLSFDSLVDLHFRVQTVLINFWLCSDTRGKCHFSFLIFMNVLALKMKKMKFSTHFWKHVNQFETEILANDRVELSDKILNFLFKNGVTAKIQWRFSVDVNVQPNSRCKFWNKMCLRVSSFCTNCLRSSLIEPRQANLCLRAFRHDKL